MCQREERPVRVPATPSHRAHKKQYPFKMGKAGRNGRGACETPWRDPHKTQNHRKQVIMAQMSHLRSDV